MKQNSIIINLLDFTNGKSNPFGNQQGKETFALLKDFVDSHPNKTVFGISLADIEATDASFPRESVLAIAKSYRGDRGFYIQDIKNPDLLDNWDYAAKAKEQPLVVWDKDQFQVLGPELSTATRDLVHYVLRKASVTVSQVAVDLELSVPNASTRLKKLVDAGYILRTEATAESGGIEYIYQAIK